MSGTAKFDPRITPARADLAAEHLRGEVTAERYVKGTHHVVVAPIAPVRRAPKHDAELQTQALMGEGVTAYEVTEAGWTWGQLDRDGYVGWMPTNALGEMPKPTHKISALRTLMFAEPSIKTPPVAGLPFGAEVPIVRTDNTFGLIDNGGFVPVGHLAALDANERDWVSVAAKFLHTPYLWGGKSSLGIDCSGLVQVALTACGLACPRDSDMQERALGEKVSGGIPALRRGDFIFWKGHVGIAADASTLLHANAHHMATVVEPLSEALPRIKAAGSDVISVRRIA
ncbi:dipeptidyl-peptidase 6 [Variibacter gotjawalensis]|uniref:Dipeptidyl-peptidase 6 n=1 Tax=Variibacter gotjawalensis TaxID=1333996 RepID=A0A0S3PPG7_9BRAD|nr:NlpC/P60 family protein [Variibacter gotjawalensis]NIK48099.1 cell wall-associated NlpC family hydrolase [Variibacter gotjawalensis]RZS49975.1 NlpC/P60 family protein [Variibacter gotjawalensis]BAT57802.1 dipeptidyl-peptidase 6 [Variibacter gotjawalensis]